MTGLLVVLTLLEIVVLVAVLALFLHLLAGQLRSIVETLARADAQVGAIEKDLGILRVGAPVINARLQDIVGALSGVAEKAERAAGR